MNLILLKLLLLIHITCACQPLQFSEYEQNVLVLTPTGTSEDVALATARTMLTAHGLRYTEIPFVNTTTRERFSSTSLLPALTDACDGHPLFSAIVLVTERLAYPKSSAPSGFADALTTSEENALNSYQAAHRIRSAVLYAYPSLSHGLQPDAGGGKLVTGNFSTKVRLEQSIDGLKGNLEVDITGSFVNIGYIFNPAMASVFASFTNPTNGVAAATVIDTFGVERLFFYCTLAAAKVHSIVFSSAWINWVSRGVYVGSRRSYLWTETLDMFWTSNRWNTHTSTTNDTIRITASDLAWHADWSARLNQVYSAAYKPALKFIGMMVYGPLLQQAKASSSAFYWGSQTWSHSPLHTYALTPTLCLGRHVDIGAGVHYDEAVCEIQRNFAVVDDILGSKCGSEWQTSTCINYSPHSIKTTGDNDHTNHNTTSAMQDNGIKYILAHYPLTHYVPDINPYHALPIDGLLMLPKSLIEVYASCATIDENIDLYNFIIGGNHDFDAFISQEKARLVPQLLAFRHDCFVFHQANMHVHMGPNATTSLLSYWVEMLISEVRSYYSLPVISLKMDDMGILYRNRMDRDNCTTSVRLVFKNDALIGVNVTAISSCVLGVTGVECLTSSVASIERYGPDTTTWITLKPQVLFVPTNVDPTIIPVSPHDVTAVFDPQQFTMTLKIAHPYGPGYRRVSSSGFTCVWKSTKVVYSGAVNEFTFGVYRLDYSTFPGGTYTVSVMMNGVHITGSPYTTFSLKPIPVPCDRLVDSNVLVFMIIPLSCVLVLLVAFLLVFLKARRSRSAGYDIDTVVDHVIQHQTSEKIFHTAIGRFIRSLLVSVMFLGIAGGVPVLYEVNSDQKYKPNCPSWMPIGWWTLAQVFACGFVTIGPISLWYGPSKEKLVREKEEMEPEAHTPSDHVDYLYDDMIPTSFFDGMNIKENIKKTVNHHFFSLFIWLTIVLTLLIICTASFTNVADANLATALFFIGACCEAYWDTQLAAESFVLWIVAHINFKVAKKRLDTEEEVETEVDVMAHAADLLHEAGVPPLPVPGQGKLAVDEVEPRADIGTWDSEEEGEPPKLRRIPTLADVATQPIDMPEEDPAVTEVYNKAREEHKKTAPMVRLGEQMEKFRENPPSWDAIAASMEGVPMPTGPLAIVAGSSRAERFARHDDKIDREARWDQLHENGVDLTDIEAGASKEALMPWSVGFARDLPEGIDRKLRLHPPGMIPRGRKRREVVDFVVTPIPPDTPDLDGVSTLFQEEDLGRFAEFVVTPVPPSPESVIESPKPTAPPSIERQPPSEPVHALIRKNLRAGGEMTSRDSMDRGTVQIAMPVGPRTILPHTVKRQMREAADRQRPEPTQIASNLGNLEHNAVVAAAMPHNMTVIHHVNRQLRIDDDHFVDPHIKDEEEEEEEEWAEESDSSEEILPIATRTPPKYARVIVGDVMEGDDEEVYARPPTTTIRPAHHAMQPVGDLDTLVVGATNISPMPAVRPPVFKATERERHHADSGTANHPMPAGKPVPKQPDTGIGVLERDVPQYDYSVEVKILEPVIVPEPMKPHFPRPIPPPIAAPPIQQHPRRQPGPIGTIAAGDSELDMPVRPKKRTVVPAATRDRDAPMPHMARTRKKIAAAKVDTHAPMPGRAVDKRRNVVSQSALKIASTKHPMP